MTESAFDYVGRCEGRKAVGLEKMERVDGRKEGRKET